MQIAANKPYYCLEIKPRRQGKKIKEEKRKEKKRDNRTRGKLTVCKDNATRLA